jgi:hypothetical protein
MPATRRALRALLAALAAVAVLAPAAHAADSAHVAVDQNGHASFVWRNTAFAPGLIQERRRTSAGVDEFAQIVSPTGAAATSPRVAVSPIFNLSPTGGSDALAGEVAMDASGLAAFIWGWAKGPQNLVQGRTRSAGGVLSSRVNLAMEGAPGDVALEGSGNASFIWNHFDGADLIAQGRRRSAAGVLSGVFDLSAAGANTDSMDVAMDPSRAAMFMWRRGSGADVIAQARRRSPGGTLEAGFDVSPTPGIAADPHVAVDPAGNATFVWSRGGIVEGRRRAATGALSSVFVVSD